MRISDWSSDVCSSDLVPLQAVADVEFGAGPTEIRRYNQIRRVVIGVDLAPGVVNSEAMAKINALPTLNNLPQGVRKIDIGDAKWQAEMVANFATAVMSGVLLVFAVLVLLYKRIRSEEHTSELQSLMRISYAVFCLKKKKTNKKDRLKNQ